MKKKIMCITFGLLLLSLGIASTVYARQTPINAGEVQNFFEDEPLDDDSELAMICSGEIIHPVMRRLVESYAVEYETLLFYFCESDFGIGEIRHALITAEREGVGATYEDLLEWRDHEGLKDVGWGEIWQALGLIGNGKPDHEQWMKPEAMNGLEEDQGENKPAFPPGLSGEHPGRGRGLKK
jgi:hypothetical protein